MAGSEIRSSEIISRDDLRRLGQCAMSDLQDLYARKPPLKCGIYADRLIALCVWQGAAEHYVRPGLGVKDFDVWAFYQEHPDGPFPARRRGKVDYGKTKFGRHPNDEGYLGRRIDVIGRSIQAKDTHDIDAICSWLRLGKTKSSRILRERPVVVIIPESRAGQVIWDLRFSYDNARPKTIEMESRKRERGLSIQVALSYLAFDIQIPWPKVMKSMGRAICCAMPYQC